MRNLLVITARGGSKGIPLKNIKELNGNPLIFYAIKEALKCSDLFEHIIVSTDSEKIKKISQDFGAEVPFLRPEEFSTDKAESHEALIHALKYFEQKEHEKYDWILLLQPTNPLLKSDDIRQCISIAKDFRSKAKTVVSVVRVANHLPSNLYISKECNKLEKFNKESKRKPRQEYTDNLFKTNGSIYMVNRDHLVQNNSIYSEDIFYLEVPKTRYVDIDDEEDFLIASKLLG